MTVIMVNGEAADVAAILASKYAHNPAAAYVTGGYPVEWTPAQIEEFARVIRIDQSAGADPAIAVIARVKDVETGAGRPADIPAWLTERESTGHFTQSTVYCDLSTIPRVLEAVGGDMNRIPRWWPAWWWNRPGIPTAEQVLAEVKQITGVDLPPERLWACQYRNAASWELSVVYGDTDFDRP